MNVSNVGQFQTVSEEDSLSFEKQLQNRREPYQKGFEAILAKAQDQEVTFNTSQEFIATLSEDELNTLKGYSMVMGDIDVDTLTREGAYNLISDFSQKRDYDGDGVVQNGNDNNIAVLSMEMYSDEVEAFTDALASTDNKDQFNLMSLITKGYDSNGEFVARSVTALDSFENIMSHMDNLLDILDETENPDATTLRQFRDKFSENYLDIENNKTEEEKALPPRTMVNVPTDDMLRYLELAQVIPKN